MSCYLDISKLEICLVDSQVKMDENVFKKIYVFLKGFIFQHYTYVQAYFQYLLYQFVSHFSSIKFEFNSMYLNQI
jgi:hypothetical protein